MPLFVIGLNHTTAPLALRERVAFAPSEIVQALPQLRRSLHKNAQVALVSTCNRTEIYAVTDESHTAEHALHWLADYHQISRADLATHSYHIEQQAAVQHAFKVASGMDSMVLGEPQILGQMKQAMRLALDAGTSGTHLQQWFDKTFAVAKQVRTQTAIGEHSVSMAAAAVKLARRVFDDFAQLNVLLVGAGEMMEVVAAHIAGQNPARLSVANRSMERAQQLLAPYPHLATNTLRLAQLPEQLAQFDLVVTCTASSLPMVGLGMVEAALKQRRHRPMVMVDLGVPRDIEAAVAKLDDVYLYTVDDLSNIVQHNSAQRTAALHDAQVIVDAHVAQFDLEQNRRHFTAQVTQLRGHFEDIRANELDRAIGSLGTHASDEVIAAMQQLSKRLTNKFLHAPTVGIQSTEPATRQAWQTVSQDWLKKSRRHAARDAASPNSGDCGSGPQ
ncbi:MAG: glutamyl-tRNA reductase [Formosimonas sp.]